MCVCVCERMCVSVARSSSLIFIQVADVDAPPNTQTLVKPTTGCLILLCLCMLAR